MDENADDIIQSRTTLCGALLVLHGKRVLLLVKRTKKGRAAEVQVHIMGTEGAAKGTARGGAHGVRQEAQSRDMDAAAC